jgi:hypothetical protein
MPAKKMKQIAFDNGLVTTWSLLGEMGLGSYVLLGVFKSGQVMGERSRMENWRRMRVVSGRRTATAVEVDLAEQRPSLHFAAGRISRLGPVCTLEAIDGGALIR